MTESGAAEPSRDDDQALRKRLLIRVGAAVAVMVVLVAGLLIFDALVVKPERPTASKTAHVTEPAVEEKPVEKAEAVPEPEKTPQEVAAESAKPAAEVAAEPEVTSAPEGTMPPAKPERPLTLPAKPQIATMKPTGPVMILPPLVSKEAARPPVPAIAKAHEAAPAAPAASAKPAEAPAVKPLAQAIEAARHFLVQVGVFSSVANAEELRAKLELAGVPAQIEARVQVGPFASRQEAEQARAKLKELGIEPGMVVAAHNK